MQMEITSRDNARFKFWKSLLVSKGIRKEGQFLLSGEKLIRELVKNLEVVAELVPPNNSPITKAPDIYNLTSELFRELDEIGTHHSILVVKAPTIPAWDPNEKINGLEIFSPLGDPQNLGALLRSAEAFGAERVVLLEESANPYLPKALKASAGSSLRVKLAKGPKLSELKGEFYALDLDGTPLTDHVWKKSARLLIGEEGPGFSASKNPNMKFSKIKIPTQGVESLNAAIAASITLFHYRSQIPK